jgi:uncharacterized membrane protein YhaH (DUF805 family)
MISFAFVAKYALAYMFIEYSLYSKEIYSAIDIGMWYVTLMILVTRFHDFGFSMAIPLGFLVVNAVVLPIMVARYLDLPAADDAALAAGMPSTILFILFAIVTGSIRGDQAPNRYGPVPGPGGFAKPATS